MRHTILSLFLFLAAALAFAGDKPASRLGQLSWMAGHWRGTAAGATTEEWWTSAGGGLMLGLHRDVTAKGTSFEYMRIEEKDGRIAYLASPQGRPATRFDIKESSSGKVVFENLQHDFPQRIIYWKDRNRRLCARVEGVMGGREAAEEWCWQRVSD